MNNPEAAYFLTKREREVLVMIAEGYSQKEIADRLYVSPNTINTHTQNIYRKMDVHTSAHAIAKAFRANVLA